MAATTCQKKTGPLSKNDPSSFSNPDEVKVERVNFIWSIDFDKNVISGSATYDLVAIKPEAEKIIFDVCDLKVSKVEDISSGSPLSFSFGTAILDHGQPMTINLPAFNAQNSAKIKIEYETSPGATGLQWMSKEQTLMKKLPYLFSQCQSIFARSLFPCQDTPSVKFTYSAEVTAIKDAEVLMSAVKGESQVTNDNHRTHHFEQKIPIPAYLVAIASGGIEGKRIGPRSQVWAEKDLLEKAAFDFSETENMLQAAEKFFGEYVWGVYDILVLPPSFPYGGMENPCLTFVTPTLLTGDKSLSWVITHEICHSWFGNLVTNTTFEHFWLNEGFTVFAENKVHGALKGEKYRQFCHIGGIKELANTVKAMGADNPLTKLVPNLDIHSPEDSFCRVPYYNGCTFLYFLEQKVGGPTVFEPFLKTYVAKNRFKSIDTDTFKAQFIGYFTESGNESLIADIDWEGWLFTMGMPLIIPDFDTSLSKAGSELKNKWVRWDSNQVPCPFKKDEISEWIPEQVIVFLAELLEDENLLGLDKVKAMQEVYDFNSANNCEIYHQWLALCIRNGWMEALPLAVEYISEIGRMSLIRPIYQELSKHEVMRAKAIENLENIKSTMMQVSINCVSKDLKIGA